MYSKTPMWKNQHQVNEWSLKKKKKDNPLDTQVINKLNRPTSLYL